MVEFKTIVFAYLFLFSLSVKGSTEFSIASVRFYEGLTVDEKISYIQSFVDRTDSLSNESSMELLLGYDYTKVKLRSAKDLYSSKTEYVNYLKGKDFYPLGISKKYFRFGVSAFFEFVPYENAQVRFKDMDRYRRGIVRVSQIIPNGVFSNWLAFELKFLQDYLPSYDALFVEDPYAKKSSNNKLKAFSRIEKNKSLKRSIIEKFFPIGILDSMKNYQYSFLAEANSKELLGDVSIETVSFKRKRMDFRKNFIAMPVEIGDKFAEVFVKLEGGNSNISIGFLRLTSYFEPSFMTDNLLYFTHYSLFDYE